MQPCYVLSMEKQINMNDPRIEIFKEKKQELTDKKRQASTLGKKARNISNSKRATELHQTKMKLEQEAFDLRIILGKIILDMTADNSYQYVSEQLGFKNKASLSQYIEHVRQSVKDKQ